MGQGKIGKSKSVEYSTPNYLINPLINEFALKVDVCASNSNHKLPEYYTKEQDAFTKDWIGNCWINPPFSRDLKKWVKKAFSDTEKFGGNKVLLIPVRSNTKWWSEVAQQAEIRFITGEVKFNNSNRGLWMPLCIMIFGNQARKGKFYIIDVS